jgi:membrane protease YdiL (CAAX protease family)
VTQRARWWIKAEIAIVLALTLGRSVVYSVIVMAERLTRGTPLGQQTTSMNNVSYPERPWLSISVELYSYILPVAWVALALYLLHQSRRSWPDQWEGAVRSAEVDEAAPDQAGGTPDEADEATLGVKAVSARRLIGLDFTRPWRDLGYATGLLAAVGGAGLAFYLVMRALGLNTTVAAANMGDTWWAIPALVISALLAGLEEEVIMLGYLLTRLKDLAWNPWAAITLSAAIRGGYHLYQGWGGAIGNLVMGLVFGYCYQRWGRVMPLVIAHTLMDVVAFVGYALIAPYVSWL